MKKSVLISERIRCYVHTYYQLDPADLQPQRDTRQEALEQEKKACPPSWRSAARC